MATVIHQKTIIKRAGVFSAWERSRHSGPVHWFIECFAEMLGVFFYCYAGIGASAAYTVGQLSSEPALGSLLSVGLGYAFGVVLAITIASATSGGHFNPCVSIAFVIFKGFPPLKALRYIVFQVLGAYIACLLIYAQYRDTLVLIEAGLKAKGVYNTLQFSATGPAGIFALYVSPTAHMGRVFLNEFVVDVFLALTIWACLDPSNLLIPPPAGPWIIGFAYGVAIWGYAANGLAANAARDVGGRLAAMTIWGKIASGPGSYAAIAALTNIPATLFAALIYEIFLTDGDRVLGRAQVEFLNAHKNHGRSPHRDHGVDSSSDSIGHHDEKGHVDTIEHAHRV